MIRTVDAQLSIYFAHYIIVELSNTKINFFFNTNIIMVSKLLNK